MKLINNRTNTGFTLIETFVAITVLLIAAVGPLTLLSNYINDALFIQNQMTASYLAQEGLDMIINKRDNNRSDPFNVNGAFEGFPGGCDNSSGSACRVDLKNGKVEIEDNVTDYFLYKDTNGYLSHNSAGTRTNFERKVWLVDSRIDPPGANEKKVIMQVEWTNKLIPTEKVFKITALLYNY